jgi:hypothetical protein
MEESYLGSMVEIIHEYLPYTGSWLTFKGKPTTDLTLGH